MEFIHHLLTSILILNIIGFLGSLFFAEYKEKQIKYYCFSIVGIIFLHLLILVFLHLVKHFPSYEYLPIASLSSWTL
ncbi:MAG: hypothetical protein KatS3mg027_2305 [Bacteroidia bacterium]|nr:MAG: hypothetical protein KatS3mg027_2305 [Bacteroidia bacterium]